MHLLILVALLAVACGASPDDDEAVRPNLYQYNMSARRTNARFHRGRSATAQGIAASGAGGNVRTSSKQGIALLGNGSALGGDWDGVNYVTLAQAALNQQDPAFWFNGHVGKQGVVSPSGSIFMPAFSFLTDVTHANCLTALADADARASDGKKIITTFGEPELPASQNGNTYTAAQTAAAWGALVNDPAWVGQNVLFVGPYISTGAGSQYYTDFIAACTASGFRLPDMLASEKYGIWNQTVTSQANLILTRFDNDHAAYPALPIVGLGMAVLGPSNQPPGPVPSNDYVFQLMQLLHSGLESRSYVAYYSWFIAGPSNWTPFRTSAGNNMMLFGLNTDNPPIATPIGNKWRALCHN